MKPKIKITRTNFPNQSMIYWMTYFINILEKKYEVIIDNINPDLVFWTNVFSSQNQLDVFTNELAKSHTDFPNAKKIYCSCEMTPSHLVVVDLGNDYYAIGPEPLEHKRYLYLPIHNTTAAWGLYDESKFFQKPYDWLTEPRDGTKILNEKKHFCGVVQNSVVPLRVEYFEKLSNYKNVRASGQWITNVPPNEQTITHPRTDGEGYLSKVKFLKDCKFSLQVQSNVLPYLTVEKMIHAYASNTLPIYYGNNLILKDGFNPNAFVNCHDYNSSDKVIETIIKIDNDDDLYVKMMSEPIFVGNKLPDYFNHDYVLNFLEKIIDNQ